jgi:transketolase
MRSQFAKTVHETLEKDSSSVVLIGDISHYLLSKTETAFPDRFFNAGICEQSLVGLASGMSMAGMKPIVHTIAPFCVERSFEQIKIDMCYQNTDVAIVSVGSSFDYASLGCTHHCYEDVSILRSIPNIDVFVPGSSAEFDNLFKKSWNKKGPKYFKLTMKEHKLDFVCDPYEVKLLKKSEKNSLTFIVNGHLVQEVSELDLDCNILYCPTLSSLNDDSKSLLLETVSSSEAVLAVEENSVIGGLGDFVFDMISENQTKMPNKFKKIGIPRNFLTNYGTADQHRVSLGLTKNSLFSIARNILEK